MKKIGRKNIALLFFTFSAQKEAKRKNWFAQKNNHHNLQIASSLIYQTTQSIQKIGLPIFHYDESLQKGESFGERFANAFQELFNKGYDAVIAIGNDSPTIDQTNWVEVQKQLENQQCVIGPDLRGGTYLTALTKEAFDKTSFQNLPWQTSALLEVLNQYLEKQGFNPFILTPQRDLNSLQDLKKTLQKKGFSSSIYKLLRFLLKSPQLVIYFVALQRFFRTFYHSLRAPPAF